MINFNVELMDDEPLLPSTLYSNGGYCMQMPICVAHMALTSGKYELRGTSRITPSQSSNRILVPLQYPY